MLEVIIDGKTVGAEKGEFILSASRRAGIDIPTLCHHSALPGLGSCRLCIVEVSEGNDRKVVASCVYPLRQNCRVFTKSEKIIDERRVIISMLHDRAPEDPYLLKLCEEYRVLRRRRYLMPPRLKCVLCGRCAAACEAMGSGAISTTGRGTGKKVSTPYDESSADCIGCGACAAVCPVGAIEVAEDDKTRTLWNKTFKLAACERCGVHYGTEEELLFLKAKLDARHQVNLSMCPDCRKRSIPL